MNIFEDAIHQFIPTSKPSKDRRKKLRMNWEAASYAKEEVQSLETI